MKKVFLLLTMLLFAVTGVMRAQTLTVHDGTATNGNVPVYGFYADAYNKCEMVYPAAELSEMNGGMINSLTFYATQASVNWGSASFQVFVTEVENETISAFAGPGTVVYEGALSISGNEMVVTFNAPYSYGGGNLLVGFYQTATGSYVTSTWKGETVTGTSVSGYNYSSLSDCSASQRNFLPKTTFEYVAGGASSITTNPSPLALGYRPNGAWMAPYVFNIENAGGAVTVNAMDISGDYFTYNAEVPAAIYAGNPLEVTLTTGEAEAGDITSTLTVLYGGNRDAEQFEVTATAYDPVDGDVWENAVEVNSIEERVDYQTNMPAGIYHNYELPEGSEAADAVYEMTFENDVLLYAGVEYATDGELALYTEGFEGVGGPSADNNYEYNGPVVNPGPTSLWFYYDYTGSNTWYGTSAGGGFFFGYKISTDVIEANGLAGLTITTVEAAAREAYPYHCYIIEGGVDPFDGNQIGGGSIENPEPLYFFDINLNMPAYISGNDDIWVIFYSDSPYAAYCGRYPADVNNGKIWTCNPNATTPTWTSNTSYTPVIYARMLELPTGREVTMNLADMSMPQGNGVVSEVAEAEGNVMNVAKANMRNRTVETLTVHDGANTNSYVPAYGFYADAYLKCEMVYPAAELADMNGGTINSMTFYASTPAEEAWTGAWQVFVTEVANTTISAFAGPGTVVYEGLLDATGSEMTINFSTPYTYNGGNLLVGVYHTETGNYKSVTWAGETVEGASVQGYNYSSLESVAASQRNFLPKTTFAYEAGSTPEPPTPGYEPYVPGFTTMIDGMYVPAGTYYLVAASDVEEAVLSFAIADVPAPEPSIVLYPYDGETNVEAPYLAEWELGDYTTEMQVLVGTQYPPTTALIDWTDYLVESAFLMDLEPNQSYFMQVNGRNAAGTTMGEIIAFTTPIDPVAGFEVEEDQLYPGEAAVFTWEANRTLIGYNIYMDGVKVNEDPITENTFSFDGLEYNMPNGNDFTVTAVYGAGESAPSEPITVYMTGTGVVMGHVYDAPNGFDPEDPDQSHPVAGVPVTMIVLDEYNQVQHYEYFTDEEGLYMGDVLAGMCVIGITQDNAVNYGYAVATIESIYVNVAYEDVIDGLDIYTHEYYYPLSMITATEEENDVLVEWAWTPAEVIVDFETGDFSQAEFTLPATYPWAITTTNPHTGTYGMKSTCEGVASGTSSIEATVEVPYDAKMGFWVKVSSETNYDKFHFYIDGVEQGSALSGALDYQYKEYTVAEGTHTYKWEYAKDSSVNSNDDCVYVDDITMYRQDVPVPPTPGATVYDFEDQTMMSWTSLDADGDGYGWVSSADPGQYHNAGVSLAGTGHNASQGYVISGSYSNSAGVALNPDNYLIAPAQISAQSGASISFYACAQDASYAAEHFGVAVSTGAATSANFTTVQEWTLTAKGAPAADVNRAVRGTTAQGNWYQYTVDLSSYAGQDIWVAIRHFNCYDQFILNIDDITINDGSAKVMPRGDRSLMSYNLYRRNDLDTIDPEYQPTLIAEGLASDVMSYIDNEWATLPYGEYQWGIQATYEGYAPVPERSRETATFGFEGGLEGWTGIVVNTDGGEWIHSDDNLGGYDYSEHAHTGTGFAMCYSFVDYVGSFDTDAYLVSPQKYSVDANSSISFWADNANDSYPENFSVCVSTAATPTAASFTQVWSGGAKGTGNGGATVRRAENRYDNWRSHEISLAAYAGQEIWIAFHDVNYDMYEIWIDDVTINYAGGAPVPPTPGPTGDGLSEILWSNVVDKDMESTLTFNIALNNGQDPEGVEVELENEFNEYEALVNETGVLVMNNVRKGAYVLEIEFDGYESIEEIVVIDEDEMTFDYVLAEIIAPVSGLYVSPTGWAMWEGGTVGPTPGPGPQPGGDDSFTEDFEGGLNGWNVLTVNADGGDWIHSDDNLGGYDYTTHAHSGSGFAMCYSFVDYVGSFDTDSYMYTPQMYSISNGSTLAFWADNANDSYPENFSVCVATAANPTAADFTTVWSGGAKGTGSNGATVRRAENRYDNWRSHEVDLSAYAGQNVWIAFHDVNYDMYEIWIDDVTLGVANKGDRAAMSYKVFLEGTHVGDTKYPFFQVPVEGLVEGETYTVGVAPLFATGMGATMEATFVYSACENYAGATSYSATVNDNDVTLTWTLPGTPGPGPGPGPQPGPEETFDFDDSTLQGWTTIDGGSPSGYGWHLGSTTLGTGYGHNGSADLVISQSYDNNYGVIYPNNFLISPAKAQYAQISFWACGQDASYAAEHFGVAVSTGNATASDFVMVNEWTIGSKGEAYAGPRGARAQSTWTQYTADLSAYAGQEIWVAIRHFNCSDMFYLDVDDITLTSAAKRNRTVVYEPHFVTDPGAMANGADASWIKNGQSTWGPNINNGGGYKLADDFTLDAATTITEIEVYGYQTGSTTTSTFTGLYAQIYNGAPNAGGQVVWGDETSNIMTSTSFTNCYRGSDGETTATTRPLMAITAENLNIELEAGTYYLVWSLAGSASSGPWAGIEALPGVGNTGDGIQYSASSGWANLMDSGAGTPYGGAFKLVGEGGGPGPGPQPVPGELLGVMVWRDGEPLTMAPITATTLIDTDVEAGEHEYSIRVVYSDYAMACDQIETVTVGDTPACDPVINPSGYYMNYQGQEGLVIDWTDPEGVTAIGLYEIDGGTPVFIGNAAPGQHPIFLSFEGQVPAGTITLGFVAVYADCESDMVTCDIYYDAVEEQEVVNAIYPNPTSGDLHVNATAMTHVTVYNAMGQMVYDQEVSGDELILNMGQYEAGVYMVKVTTETGSSVKRINVVK